MAEAIVMFLDAAASAAVESLRDQLDRHGLVSPTTNSRPRHRPHVSLAVARTITLNDPSLISRIAQQRLDIRMESIGTFAGPQGVLFLGVTVTQSLQEAQRRQGRLIVGPPPSTPRSLIYSARANDRMTAVGALIAGGVGSGVALGS
ncbi:hypothetical protein [Streptomyces sp. NPDC050287]|uniref:hypothetical protein n=1 Tax=Streptomyces sp. NPDC050287 TaxID=3365608 RepID=UPI0037AE5C80